MRVGPQQFKLACKLASLSLIVLGLNLSSICNHTSTLGFEYDSSMLNN